MNLVLFLLLIIVAGIAIAGAKKTKWKLINLIIILGFAGFGLAVGYCIGLWRHNMALGTDVAIPLGISLAAAGVAGCSAWNKRRARVSFP
jgi:hypothetical protein